MKKLIAAFAAAAVMAIAPASALGKNADAPGWKIKNACGGKSFGQLVSGGKKSGDSNHQNYAGGAKAFSVDETLEKHGCTVNGS